MNEDDNDDFSNAFLTEVDAQKKRIPNERLLNIRFEHSKLQDVVMQFRGKVDVMVEKQRLEFMQAYEHHVHDVQKELNFLREKVNEIANDKTKEDKMQSLDNEQKQFKNEALALDHETNDLRKRLRLIAAKILTVEKERDWLLKKLRVAKRRYRNLQAERSRVVGSLDMDGGGSVASVSNDSLLTVEVCKARTKFGDTTVQRRAAQDDLADWKQRIQHEFTVSRDASMMSALPRLAVSSSTPSLKLNGTPSSLSSADKLRAAANSATKKQTQQHKSVKSMTRSEKDALAELVGTRARQESIRDFVAQCSDASVKGAWSRTARRPFMELLEACTMLTMRINDSTSQEEVADYDLIQHLALTPETYYALSDLLSGRYGTLNLEAGGDQNNGMGMGMMMYNKMNNQAVSGDIDNDSNAMMANMCDEWADLQALPDEMLIQADDDAGGDMAAMPPCTDDYNDEPLNLDSRAVSAGLRMFVNSPDPDQQLGYESVQPRLTPMLARLDTIIPSSTSPVSPLDMGESEGYTEKNPLLDEDLRIYLLQSQKIAAGKKGGPDSNTSNAVYLDPLDEDAKAFMRFT